MELEAMKQELRKLLLRANPDVRLAEDGRDLFSVECGVSPRDLLFVCMELKKRYLIDYNQMVDQVELYSLDQLARAFCAQINRKEPKYDEDCHYR